jgi:hypothetical protein
MDISKIFSTKLNDITKKYNSNNGLLYNINNLTNEINDSLEVKNTITQCIVKLNYNKFEYIPYSINTTQIILISQWYNTENKQRQKENTICLINNILNPLIDIIILLNEEFYDFKNILKGLDPKLKSKVRQKIINKRLTFYDVFDYVNKNLKNNIIILSNLDIFFDNTIQILKNIDFNNLFFSVSRFDLVNDYEFDKDNTIIKFNHDGPLGNPCIDSNDAWIFKSPIKIDNITKEIFLGSNGCDTIINEILSNLNYNVVNPIDSIKIIHYHLNQERDNFTTNDIRYNSLKINENLKYNPANYQHKYLLPKKILLTTKLYSICTICNKNAYADLKILLYSITLFEPNIQIYILTDYYVNNKLYIDFPNLNIISLPKLDKYKHIFNNTQQKNKQEWNEFMLEKLNIIHYTLENEHNTLFLDSDQVLLNKLNLNIPYDYDLGLSPHNINKKQTDLYGYFNGGFIYISNIDILDKWRDYTLSSRYYEQASLEDLNNDNNIKTFYFNITYNYGWWTFFQSDLNNQIVKNNFTIDKYNNDILYDYKPLRTIHSHVGVVSNDYQNQQFNIFIINLLKTSSKTEYKLLLNFIENNQLNHNKYNIYIPKQPRQNSFYNHKNDTFRELCYLWKENNLCNLIENDNEHIWFNNINDILLYDRPTLDWLQDTKYNHILLGNPNDKINNSKEWIFWPRSPRELEKIRYNIIPYKNRHINSIFIGKIENSVQQNFRNNSIYKNYIEFFQMMNPNEKYKYSQQEYLNLLVHSKFGLCLRGYGPKCNREIELLALGTIPLITSDVDLTYYNDLIEGKHYFLITKPQDIDYHIYNTTEAKWNQMSQECIKWYENNCSITGSFKTTLEIINNINNNTLNKEFFDNNNIILHYGLQKKIQYSNPISITNNLKKLFINHNKNHTPLPFNDKNNFTRLQYIYLVYLKNIYLLKDGLMLKQNKNHIYTLNNIFKLENTSSQISLFPNNTIVFNLVQQWAFGYYHFLIEILPRIIFCINYINNNHILFKNKNIIFILYYNKSFIHNFLTLLANHCIKDIEIIQYNPNIIYNIPNCLFYTPTVCGNPTIESIELIENSFNLSENNYYNIIIYRKNNLDRSISNFTQCINLLEEKFGKFVIFDSDNFSTIQTINLFQNANIIIAPHGAGLANIIFSNNSTKVIEFIPEDNPNLCYYHLCRLKNIKHFIIPVENYLGNGSFRINYDLLYTTLTKII